MFAARSALISAILSNSYLINFFTHSQLTIPVKEIDLDPREA